MTKLILVLQASFNTPEYGSSIGETVETLFGLLVVVVIGALIYRLFSKKK
ncbi:hypothetical protein [Ichthyenterobacterium magnum]|uniref:Uncharacterized protein n=1 Tax=Ichthyenterobacterium magnum TaxID=1230530 RepID=A0A420DCW3_9FLAO|nr:hypothetical protein [Ichthyenterobacterium magnum]RKE89439.1 hypothetical protein BXY80_2788 [Ichthyenterobacterium magnum]